MKYDSQQSYEIGSSGDDGRGVIIVTLGSALTTVIVLAVTAAPHIIRLIGNLFRTLIPGRNPY